MCVRWTEKKWNKNAKLSYSQTDWMIDKMWLTHALRLILLLSIPTALILLFVTGNCKPSFCISILGHNYKKGI